MSVSRNGQLCVWQCDTNLEGLVDADEEMQLGVTKASDDSDEDTKNSSYF